MPVWLTIILALGGSSVIGYVVTQICVAIHHKGKKYRDYVKTQKQNEMREVLQQENKPVNDKLDQLTVRLGTVENGCLSGLRNDILTCYYRCKEKGYRNDYDYQNVHHLYEAYDELHGNSFIADIMDRFDKLPVKEDTVPVKVVKRQVNKTKNRRD